MFEKLAERFKEKSKEQEITFRSYDESVALAEPGKEDTPEKKQTSLTAESRGGASNIELKVVRPESFNEVSTIADYLLADCTVVLNLELLDKAASLRMLDFLNGITYSKAGEIKKVAQSTYIITPHNVDVHDDK